MGTTADRAGRDVAWRKAQNLTEHVPQDALGIAAVKLFQLCGVDSPDDVTGQEEAADRSPVDALLVNYALLLVLEHKARPSFDEITADFED